MTKKTRKYVFSLFLLAFFVITPSVIFYSLGYRLILGWPPNFNSIIQKTGILVLESDPEGAEIFIDNEPQTEFFKKYFTGEEGLKKTPTKIKGILPGKYDIKLEAEGYWPWEKEIEIKADQSAFVENIILFKKNLPSQLSKADTAPSLWSDKNSNLDAFIPRADKNFLIFKNEGRISAINIETENILSFTADSDEKNLKISWSKDNEKFLAGKQIIKMKDPGKTGEIEKSENYEDCSWFDKIYCRDDKNIFTFNEQGEKKEDFFSSVEKIEDFFINDNFLFLITRLQDSTKLKTFSLKNLSPLSEIEIPLTNNYSVWGVEDNLIYIYDENFNRMYLINPLLFEAPLIDTINEIDNFEILNNKILYGNSHEIWLYNLKNRDKQIIIRSSSQIKGFALHPQKNHLIYATDTKIKSLELDEKRTITDLFSAGLITDFMLSSDGEAIIFTGQIGSQEGLYKLFIQ